MELYLIGINHETSNIDLREKLAFSEGETCALLRQLKQASLVQEAVLLSTCNRTEFYVAIEGGLQKPVDLLKYLTDFRQENLGDFLPTSYNFQGGDVVRHLMRVSCGCNSMVLGETEILGQCKTAYENAIKAGSVGFYMHELFQSAFRTAKRVRSATSINQGRVSVSSIAVDLAEKIYDNFTDKAVLLLGAGEAGQNILEHLRKRGVKKIIVANRTLEKAKAVAVEYEGQAIAFEHWKECIFDMDIILSSTSSAEWLLHRAELEHTIKHRPRPLFLIDLAVPRDFDPSINSIDNVFLYDMDDLQKIAQRNKDIRIEALEIANQIIDEEYQHYYEKISHLNIEDVLRDLRESLHAMGKEELQKTLSKIEVNPLDQEQITYLVERLINIVLHHPTIQIKKYSTDADGKIKMDVVRELFGLDD